VSAHVSARRSDCNRKTVNLMSSVVALLPSRVVSHHEVKRVNKIASRREPSCRLATVISLLETRWRGTNG
jgi:hypothetical protein